MSSSSGVVSEPSLPGAHARNGNGSGIEPAAANLAFAEEVYEQYLQNPASVSEEWRRCFEELAHEESATRTFSRGPAFHAPSLFNPGGNGSRDGSRVLPADAVHEATLQHRLEKLVRAYRVRGHLVAQLDPLGRARPVPVELNPPYHEISEADLDRPVPRTNVYGADGMTARQMLQKLKNTYCRTIGAQFMHIDDLEVKLWLMERMESTENRLRLSREQQVRILRMLTDAALFEEFIQKKFTGAKSFSLEGGESLIPLLDMAIEQAGEEGCEEVVLAMAHRGRLNVLANIMGKHPRRIFQEFEDSDPKRMLGGGDVKYHLGHSNDWVTHSGRKVHLTLCFNPSHLEYVNPVALGRTRAKQDRRKDAEHRSVLALVIHGDAAFAGEGVVQETLNLSQLESYSVGGTLHVVVNNQIGFTTPPEQGRSTPYATAVAKMLQAPIFHVNGEDPEAVAQTILLAMEFRRIWKRDVFVDMYCYRRRGHNEGDEPSFTQPLLYRAIEKRKSVREAYLENLRRMGEIEEEEAADIERACRDRLEKELSIARSEKLPDSQEVPAGFWQGYHGGDEETVREVRTNLPKERLTATLEKLATVPEGFNPNRKLQRWLELRREMARGEKPLDWAAAEALALATLAADGYRIRMTGQDVERGTFSHRHCVLHDHDTGREWRVLENVDPNQAPVTIRNSPLCETGVLGYEYGYSLDWPDALVVWEAQFGDFVNCAQVIVDQFIASAEDKWHRLSGLVMLLPHGFEGQGPEHSSGRLERFLQLCADQNLQVMNLTTPAQYFHCLRRQVLRRWRKPLVLMTPKSLLRHPACVSTLDDLTEGSFRRIIYDKTVAPETARRVLLCAGKVYYDLAEHREREKIEDVAILRVEQLYPLPEKLVEEALAPYAPGTQVFWVQEEPENMGAWRRIHGQFRDRLLGRYPLSYVGRPESASPATGSGASHRFEQKKLIEEAFA